MAVNIDCTPEETRTFFELPDLQPMQVAVMARIERRMVAEMDRLSLESLIKSWMSPAPQGTAPMQKAFTRIFQQGFAGGNPPIE